MSMRSASMAEMTTRLSDATELPIAGDNSPRSRLRDGVRQGLQHACDRGVHLGEETEGRGRALPSAHPSEMAFFRAVRVMREAPSVRSHHGIGTWLTIDTGTGATPRTVPVITEALRWDGAAGPVRSTRSSTPSHCGCARSLCQLPGLPSFSVRYRSVVQISVSQKSSTLDPSPPTAQW